MKLSDLYVVLDVLDNEICIRIFNESALIMCGKPWEIPVGIMDFRVKSIRKAGHNSIADIDIVIEG